MTPQTSCDSCRYSQMEGHPGGSVEWQCHRLPPHTHNNTTCWPVVNSDDWCGEWEHTK